MNLNAPKQITWLIAVILGIIGLIGFLVPTIPVISTYAFWFVFVGFALLALGSYLKGL